MNAITLPNHNINPERLTGELRAALGPDAITGLSWDDREIRVHVRGTISDSLHEAVGAVVAAHDPAALTPDQQTRAALRAARRLHSAPIDPDRATLRDLALRLRWLEQEIRARLAE